MSNWKYDRKRDAFTKAGYTIICLQEDGYMARRSGATLFYSVESLQTVQQRCDELIVQDSQHREKIRIECERPVPYGC